LLRGIANLSDCVEVAQKKSETDFRVRCNKCVSGEVGRVKISLLVTGNS